MVQRSRRARFGAECRHYNEVGFAAAEAGGLPSTSALEISAAEWSVSTRLAVFSLLDALVEDTERAGIWTVQSGVFPENEASIALHRAAGLAAAYTGPLNRRPAHRSACR
jgi:hypothetical protein